MASGGSSALDKARVSFRSANQGLAERLACVHDEIRRDFDGLHRIAITIYDPATDLLRSFVDSSEGESPFVHTVAALSDFPTLMQMAKTGGRRAINDLSIHKASVPEYVRRLVDAGYHSSYTVPIFNKGTFNGFLFFNSFLRNYFTPAVVQRLRPIAEVVSLHTLMELDSVRMIQAAVRTVRQVTRTRDEETGSHLERMSRYTRLIAQRLAPRWGLSDEFVELLYQFAPVHDVGKIGVPDHILFKPGRLDDLEFEIMKGHVAKGVEIVDVMAETFRLRGTPSMRVLRNVVAHHHECIDGSGYPYGLMGDEISLEGRIAAVADVFDALTTRRPYKAAWSNEDAIRFLVVEVGRRFDHDCVDILRNSPVAIAEIQRQFAETEFD